MEGRGKKRKKEKAKLEAGHAASRRRCSRELIARSRRRGRAGGRYGWEGGTPDDNGAFSVELVNLSVAGRTRGFLGRLPPANYPFPPPSSPNLFPFSYQRTLAASLNNE